jgi:hypothetical protein
MLLKVVICRVIRLFSFTVNFISIYCNDLLYCTASASLTGEDCSHCDHSAGPKLTKPDDVKDVPLPEWKKKALATAGATTTAVDAPFGGSWSTEAAVAATTAEKTTPSCSSIPTHSDHSHEHSHGHSHGTQ